MKILSLAFLAVMFLVCLLAEQKSRKWYDDRLLLRAQGVLLGAIIILIFS